MISVANPQKLQKGTMIIEFVCKTKLINEYWPNQDCCFGIG